MNSGNNKIAAKRNKNDFRKRKQREKKTVKVEDEGPDLDAIKLEMIKHLASKFNMEQEVVAAAHKTFMEENPSGFISKEKFLEQERVRLTKSCLCLFTHYVALSVFFSVHFFNIRGDY